MAALRMPIGRDLRWSAGRAACTILLAATMLAWASLPARGASRSADRPAESTKSPVSSGVLMARALRSGAISLPSGGLGAGVGRYPSVTVRPNVPAEVGTQPVNTTPIAADPITPSHLMSGGLDYNCASYLGFYNSDDGGASWRSHCMPVVGAGGCGSPNVAYDRNGNAFALGIGNCNGATGTLVYQVSTDNGITWGPAKTGFASLLGGLVDRPWTEIDTSATSQFKNCIYISWTDFDPTFTQTRASVAHSCDGGGHWARVAVDSTQTVPAIDQFSDLAIGADGTVYLAWMHCTTSGPAGDCGDTDVQMEFSKSIDGGGHWTPPSLIDVSHNPPDTGNCYYGCFPGTAEPLPNTPSIDQDDGNGQTCVGYDGYLAQLGGAGHREGGETPLSKHSEARMHCSSDGGVTWGPPVVVPGSASYGWVWCASNDAGRLALSFLFSSSAGTYSAGVALTKDGTTLLRKKTSTVASMAFVDDGFNGIFIGDETGAVWTGNIVHSAWMDTRSGGVSSDMTGGANT